MTPVYKIAPVNSSIGEVWAKLENQNPTGSHKDRSMERWIEHYVKQGKREFVISSSGNSAISAAKFCDENDAKLDVFVSPNASGEKLRRLREYKNIALNITKTPNKDAFQFSKQTSAVNLRASKDDVALIGYKTIATELSEQLSKMDNIFVPTSSGATLQGIYLGFKSNVTESDPVTLPSLFIAQTTKVHPIASYFDKDFREGEESLATAIVDRVAHRKDRVIEIIKKTDGGGLVISNKELEQAQDILTGTVPVKIGVHSALAFAGYLKWREQNPKRAEQQTSVCLFTD